MNLGIARNGKLADSSPLGSGSLFLGSEYMYLLIDTTCCLSALIASKATCNMANIVCCLIFMLHKILVCFIFMVNVNHDNILTANNSHITVHCNSTCYCLCMTIIMASVHLLMYHREQNTG